MNIELIEVFSLIAGITFCGFLYYLHKINVDFGIRTITALILGIVLGFLFRGHVAYIAIIGKIFVNLIYAVVVPLLAVSIIGSIITLKGTTQLKTIGTKSIGWLTGNTLIASTLTLFLSFLFRIGYNFPIELPTDYTPAEVPGFSQVIIDLFPQNIISDAANGKIVPVIIFSALIGLAILSVGEKNPDSVKALKDFVKSFSEIIFWIVLKIISFTPYAVLSLIANATSNNGPEKLAPLFIVLVVAYIACIIQTFIVGGALLKIFAGVNPVKFFKKLWPAQMVAFTSQSSMGTLPITLKCLIHDIGVSPNIANFTAPLGTSVGMPGCAGVWPTLLAVFAINALGIDYSVSQYILLILITVVVSLGTAGVPGTATITATAVFAAAGLPIEIIVILTPISSIVDMARTATNITGAAVSSVIVAKSEQEFNLEVYESVPNKKTRTENVIA